MILDTLKRIIRQRYNISFSKSGDDIQLMKLINNYTPGVYVDIGCWHPIKASNTYYFHLRKWKGICIDPNPELKSLYSKYRSSDLFLNVGIGKSDTHLSYYMLEESSMNTFSFDFIKKHNLESKIIKIIEIPLFSLKIKNFSFAKYKLQIGFLIASVLLLLAFQITAVPLIIVLYVLLSVVNNRFTKN